MNTLSKVMGYRINMQNTVAFFYTNNEFSENEIRIYNPILNSLKTSGNARNKPNQGSKRST